MEMGRELYWLKKKIWKATETSESEKYKNRSHWKCQCKLNLINDLQRMEVNRTAKSM